MTQSSERVVLDTNVLVHLIRGKDIGQRIDADHGLRARPERPIISIVSVGEIRGLALKWGWQTPKTDALEKLVRELVVVNLEQGAVIAKYAEIFTYCERDSKPARKMPQNDMWIAATAAASDARLLTTDTDFDHLHPAFINLTRLDAKTGVTI